MNEALFLQVYFGALFAILGACVGSFLNVVIYRLPAGKSVVRPRSQCRCGAPVAWYDNIPVLSWFILRGRCRVCGQAFSIRYPFVEALTAVLFVACWQVGGWPVGLVWMAFAGLMLPAAFIDLDTMELPDVFTIGGFLLGVVLNSLCPAALVGVAEGPPIASHLLGLKASLVGAFVGSGAILWIALLGELAFRKEAMGFGDVKLMGAIGAFCGWEGSLFAIFGGSVIGCAALLVCWPFMRGRGESLSRHVPFGPALVAGALLYLLGARPHVLAYIEEMRMLFHSIL